MVDIFPLQQDVNRKAALHVYFGPQVAKSRNSVSIIWRAGRPSGWALPRILVVVSSVYVCLVTVDVNVLVSCTDLQQLHSECLHLLTYRLCLLFEFL